MRIVRLVEQPDRAVVLPAIDAIFFEASNTQAFVNAADRAAFRQRWLGLYLDTWPEHVWLARNTEGTLAGYLVGCLVDPATDVRFGSIGYDKTFAVACAAYPAHLHINLAPDWRGQGIGGRLIAAFAGQVADAGLPGVHIVTGRGARNIDFYRQQEFAVVAELAWKTGHIVVMGRSTVPLCGSRA